MWNPQKAGYLLRNILGSKVVKTNLKGLPYQLFCYQLLEAKRERFVDDALIHAKSLCEDLEILLNLQDESGGSIYRATEVSYQLSYQDDLRRTMFASIGRVTAEI
ncbi:hypothetical protein TNCV_2005171 [Trichonephila clavipes]|nr:hypothetical protein TNCV_2005171 [Trichonephila clavipes]